MPRIGELFGIFFYLYFREHGVPHIHAFYSGRVAVIGLDGVLIEGGLPKKQLKISQKFAVEYATEIQQKINQIEASKRGEKKAPVVKRLDTKDKTVRKTEKSSKKQ